MFTDQDVNQLLDVSRRMEEMKGKLLSFCKEVIGFLDVKWSDVLDVRVSNEDVVFEVVWYGSYQAEDKGCYSFPAALLVEGAQVVSNNLKDSYD